MTLLIEGNFDGIVWFFLAIMFGPSLVLALIGLLVRKHHRKAAKVLFILAVVYSIISLGICGSLILAN